MDLTAIYRTFQSTATKYAFFSSVHETYFRIDPMLGHKTSFRKYKKIKLLSSVFSDHDGMKLETITEKKLKKIKNYADLKNMLLNNQWIREEIKSKI